MNNVFKKSLIAVALTGLSANAMAAVVTDTVNNPAGLQATHILAAEYVAGAKQANATTALVKMPDFDITLEQEYTVQDTVIIGFSGESLVASTLPASIVLAGASEVTLGLVGSSVVDGNLEANYRVTKIEQTGANPTTIGSTVVLSGDATPGSETFLFDATKIGAEGVSVSFKGVRVGTGVEFDKTKAPVQILAVKNTFGTVSVATPFADTILPSARSVFVAVPQTSTAAAIDLTAGAGYLHEGDVVVGKVSYTVQGNFAWALNKTKTALDALVTLNAGVNCTNTPKSITGTSMTVECAAGTAFAPVFTLGATFAGVLPMTTFGVLANVEYTAAGGTGSFETKLVDAGAWTIPATEVNVAYMPYGPTISEIINVTNRTGDNLEIYAVAYDEDGNSHDLGVVGEVKPHAIKRVAGGIKGKLSEKGLLSANSTKLFSLQLLSVAEQAVASPISDREIEVYSAYNTDGNGARLVVNDSNGASQ